MLATAILISTVFTFPRAAPVQGDVYQAPDGAYVGRLELGNGRNLKLLDGFYGDGAWCGELRQERAMIYDVVCGRGAVLHNRFGIRLRLKAPGINIDEFAERGEL